MNRVEFILSHLKGKVLDIGYYACTLHQRIKEKVPKKQLYAMDIFGPTNAHYKRASAEKKFPFPSNFFDTIVAGELIEHLHNPEIFVKESKRVLKPNGQLILTTPNRNSLINRLFKTYHAPLHFSLFSIPELTSLLEKHNFKIKKIYTLPYTEESSEGSKKPYLFPLRKFISLFLPFSLRENICLLAVLSDKKHKTK